MGLLILAAAGAAGLIGTKMVTRTVNKVNAEKAKANIEIADIQQKSEIDKKRLEMEIADIQQKAEINKKKLDLNKNVLNSDMQYSIKCVSCHAVLTGYPFRPIRCAYCDTVQSITDDSIIL